MTRENRLGWSVLLGIVLIGLGIWLLLGSLFYQVAWLMQLLSRFGWPLMLVGLGILLIIRARGGGFNVAGKKLFRSRTNRMIGGVMGGLSDYLGIDATVLRVVYAFAALFTGIVWGVLLYLLAMIIVPEEVYGADWTPAPAPPIPGQPPAYAPAPPAPPAPSGPAPAAPPVPQAPSAAYAASTPAPDAPAAPPAAPPIPDSPNSAGPSEPTVL